MIYLQLFLSFVKIGFTSFGGMSMIPVILEEMQKSQWMNAKDMSNLIAIAEMTPGPLGLNCATFAGEQTAGFLGGIMAVIGVLMPVFTITFFIAIFFKKFRHNPYLEGMLSVIKPICVAMILATILELSRENYMTAGHIDVVSCLIGILMFYLILKKSWSVPKVIVSCMILGILIHYLPNMA